MTYKEIIENNCKSICGNNRWWPKYAFHYTDVSNAIGILKEGYLYSRYDAASRHLMQNDNASRQVIDMTYSGATADVRFYFRPLTPTQYHNEGYKHSAIRYYQDENANVPVPVFFLFDLEDLLLLPEVSFSETSLAGHGGKLISGADAFAKLNFEEIYKTGWMENTILEKQYRQAEIVHRGPFSIEDRLRAIICRNDVERQTLLNILRRESNKLFARYNSKIFVMQECFENNALYISECTYYGDKAVVGFSSTAGKYRYTQKYKHDVERLLVKARAEFDYMKSSELINRLACCFNIDYESTTSMTFNNLEKPKGATSLHMKIFFENKLMCYVCWQLAEAALL